MSTTTSPAKNVDSTQTNPVTEPKYSTHGAVAKTPIPLLYQGNFTKAPQWDFDDVYNQDAPPRPTVSMLRHNMTETGQM